MMHLLAAGMATVGESVALSLIAKVTLVSGFAMVAAWLLRRRWAAVRHLMFAGAFVVIALLPVATAVTPAVPVRLLPMPARTDTAPPTRLNLAEPLRFVPGAPSEPRVSGGIWPVPSPDSGISGIAISQALQQQLGLRLESTRGPVEVIVVDQAERPSAN